MSWRTWPERTRSRTAAHVIEAWVATDGAVRVHRVVSAIDGGITVNPDQVRGQMEGGRSMR